jgi:Lon protease-like protein
MSRSPFDLGFDQLPERLPIFPLTGVLLLPRGRLPLNIFEPRYLAMTRDALGADRMIGMIQPRDGTGDAGDPPTYRTGCAGRIVSFSETDDGRFLITLTGVARFDVLEELPRDRLYRQVVTDWRPYRLDLADEDDPELDQAIDRARLSAALKPFFARHGISADFDAIAQSPAERLVSTLAMVCPFVPREKQALLEATDTAERAALLTTLIEMAVHGTSDEGDGARH